MQMRAAGFAGGSNVTDGRPLRDALPKLNVDLREVRVPSPHALPVREHDHVPPAAPARSGEDNPPRPGRGDRRPERRGKVDSGVKPRAARAEEVPRRPGSGRANVIGECGSGIRRAEIVEGPAAPSGGIPAQAWKLRRAASECAPR